MRNSGQLIGIFSEYVIRLGNGPLLIAVRRGLIYMIPLVLIGSMALVFLSLPIPAYQNIMREVFGSQWQSIFLYIRDGTFNILSLVMVLCISYSYISEIGERYGHKVSPIIASSVSLASFIAVSGINKAGFSIANFGVIGAFVAIMVSVTSSILFLKLSSIEFFRIRAFTNGANANFNYAISSVYPAAITIAVFAFINLALTEFFSISDIQSFISAFFNNAFSKMESPFWTAILFVFLIHIFWFFGMHGSNILEPVAQNIFVPALTTNQVSISLGQVPTEIFTKTFFDTFVLMGGCGTTLCLIAAILIAGKYKNQRRLARLSFIPVLFNINELIVFGIPIVLNPVYIIPFVGIPIILTIVSYISMYYGLVPYTSSLVEWTTPVLLSGYASTNSINGSILQFVNLFLGFFIYIPFVMLAERIADEQMKTTLEEAYATFKKGENRSMSSTLLTRHDDVGNMFRFLAVDLEHDLQNNKVMLYYQPQLDFEGRVLGVEALLRWKHENYGFIYPPLIIALAEESNLIDRLGNWIIDTACNDLARFNMLGMKMISVSINISAFQLENDSFIDNLREIIERHHIDPQSLTIEITEQVALARSNKVFDHIIALKNMGIKLAMDDFGMGHSSLMYLKEYDFDSIKLDGSLVREIISNNNCRDIISSIVFLGKSLNYSVIAEYVEEESQKHILHELGCDIYQGYLYSQAIPFDELSKYIISQEGSIKISPASLSARDPNNKICGGF